jgi:hypothetical protein
VRLGEVQVALRARESQYPPRLRYVQPLPFRWYPGVVALGAGDPGSFLRFFRYPKVLRPYLRSTDLMERSGGRMRAVRPKAYVKTCEPQEWPGVLGLRVLRN